MRPIDLTLSHEKSRCGCIILPLPLAGEGWGEGEVRTNHPHLHPLPPKGGRGDFRKPLPASSPKKRDFGLRLAPTVFVILLLACSSSLVWGDSKDVDHSILF